MCKKNTIKFNENNKTLIKQDSHKMRERESCAPLRNCEVKIGRSKHYPLGLVEQLPCRWCLHLESIEEEWKISEKGVINFGAREREAVIDRPCARPRSSLIKITQDSRATCNADDEGPVNMHKPTAHY